MNNAAKVSKKQREYLKQIQIMPDYIEHKKLNVTQKALEKRGLIKAIILYEGTRTIHLTAAGYCFVELLLELDKQEEEDRG